MFWTLGLAHLIADYPLQTDGLVRAKRHWHGLALHVLAHLATMILLCGMDSLVIWPALVALATAHLVIDASKTVTSARWPERVVVPYIVDQIVHIASIVLVAGWIEARYGVRRDQPWMLIAAAYLSVTHVWYITERVVAHRDPSFQEVAQTHHWSRMIVRGLALTVYLLGAALLAPRNAIAAPALISALSSLPYRDALYGRRMLVLDLLGPLIIAAIALVLR